MSADFDDQVDANPQVLIYELRVALNRIIDIARGNGRSRLEKIVDVAQSALENAGEPDE